jgi:hypothetical protein
MITVDLLSEKLLSAQVCANSEDVVAVIDVANRIYPSGTGRGWTPSTEYAPVPCLGRPGYTHYVLDA